MNIDDKRIEELLQEGKNPQNIEEILKKARSFKGLSPVETAALLQTDQFNQQIFEIANQVKEEIYGKRVVMFAPLYISDFCINKCSYCGYNVCNSFERKRLSMSQVEEMVHLLEKMGHKRLALEAGEDPVNCPLDYVLECIDTIYKTKTKTGEIRRVNVNIAATTVEDYRRLYDAKIGTYILFQETYHRKSYEKYHLSGPKSDFDYHLNAFDRAMQAGIEDVGAGVLFGLYDYKFECMALLQHSMYLEEMYGVGFHTISFPRIRPANGNNLDEYCLPTDEEFKKIIAVMRLALPYVGIIISTRETAEMRAELLKLGVSQVSGGSIVSVGTSSKQQFSLNDNRTMDEINKWLLKSGHIPSFCTACYRSGRTGDRFMQLAKTGDIKNVCLPNALMTLKEYALDFGDKEFVELTDRAIEVHIDDIKDPDVRTYVRGALKDMESGKRDCFV